MRDNLYCCRDNNGITKKFWAHVKSKTKSNRIPEVMKHKKLSSNNLGKANMFNKYFFDQFSNSSAYDIDVDFMNDNMFDIDFSCTRVNEMKKNGKLLTLFNNQICLILDILCNSIYTSRCRRPEKLFVMLRPSLIYSHFVIRTLIVDNLMYQ